MAEEPPDPTELKAALDKFGDDAKKWDQQHDTMTEAKSAADGLDIDALAFGPFAWFGLSGKYKDVQQMIVDRCNEGATEFDKIAKALIKARDGYQKDEEQGVHEVKKVW